MSQMDTIMAKRQKEMEDAYEVHSICVHSNDMSTLLLSRILKSFALLQQIGIRTSTLTIL